jgi:4-hydroxythreonine-4-phosphate dehydrogenase
MKPLLVTSGEPAGIGPDICLALANSQQPLVVVANKQMLATRAAALNFNVNLYDYDDSKSFVVPSDGLTVLSLPVSAPVIAGQLAIANAQYVIDMLTIATKSCLDGAFSALITAPINKAIINQAGIPFTGHTEFLASHCDIDTVVMMLTCETMRVALVTTHLPLQAIPSSISTPLIINIIKIVHQSLQSDFGIKNPRIFVSGLNPHAGEGGYLGREEIEIIIPALNNLRQQHIDVEGPFPADTLFTPINLKKSDVFVTMYHDQGLPVLKYAGFGQAINVTLGLPIIRTSVDHGTALELAATGLAKATSLIAAVNLAQLMVKKRAASYG